jgi:hypothetical protein
MKKILALLLVVGVAGAVYAAKAEKAAVEPAKKATAESVKPAVTADLTFELKGDKLYCYAAIKGVAKGDKVEPFWKRTPPASAQVFAADTYRGKMVRTKTNCLRTVVTTIGDKTYRATGVWTFVLMLDGKQVAEATYEVKE